MPDRISIGVDAECGLATVTVQGELNEEGVSGFFDAVFRHPDFKLGMDVLADARDASMDLSAAAMARLIDFFKRHRETRGLGKDVIVVGNDVDYGIGRMIEAYTDEHLPYEVRVFRSMREGLHWLGSRSESATGGEETDGGRAT